MEAGLRESRSALSVVGQEKIGSHTIRLKEELRDPFKLTHFCSWYIVKFMPSCCSFTSQCQICAEVIYPSAFIILSLG